MSRGGSVEYPAEEQVGCTGCPDCPVRRRADEVLDSARRLASSMRRLRQVLRQCRRCPAREECPLLQDFNRQLQAALGEIAEEWHLGETL
jgi:hypothetical protein